ALKVPSFLNSGSRDSTFLVVSSAMNQPIYRGLGPDDDLDIEINYPEEPASGSGLWAEIKSITRDIIFAAVMAVLIVVFVAQPVKVEGTSMQPRLENDERIFVNKFKYTFDEIERGEIVVFWYPEDPTKSFIKRVIGLPGELIDMDPVGRITINGHLIEEPYLAPERNQAARAKWNQVRNDFKYVKPHYYFVMGDNRDASNDSRSWGLVPEKYIYGKAMFRYWPPPRIGTLDQTIDSEDVDPDAEQ
ncbi:MAG TPA: signal peptidase I, partial [Blastocatellia bacterium]|nr:signal peptidase I [Blastocatellia bacterium]